MEASFASALTSALSNTLSARTSQQLRQIGVSDEKLHTMKEKLKSIQKFVEDVNNRSELQNEFTCWLQKVNKLTFRVQKEIDEHEYELLSRKNRAWKKPSFFSLEFRMHRRVKKIFNLLIELEKEVCKLELVKNVHIQRSLGFVGRIDDQRKIVRKLHFESEFTIAIVGIAGIGKTTFAARIYGNELPGDPFAKKFWVTVGRIFDVTEILERKQWPMEEMANLTSESKDSLMSRLQAMKGERVLLVLDDVQSVNQEQFNNLMHRLQSCGAKIKVLVTTRRIETARIIGASYTHDLQGLSDDDSWDLFRRVASRTTPIVYEMETVGRPIVQKCHGVPLAIRRLASLLQSRENASDWEVLSTILFTYNGLPKALKRCFAYCSLFPKEATIQKYDLIGLWVAQGFIPEESVDRSIDTGEIYFDILLNESLLKVSRQDEDGNIVDCTMHPLVHDLAIHFSRHDMFIVDDQSNRTIGHQSDVQHLVFSPKNMSVAKAIISHSTRLRTIYAVPENTQYPMVADLAVLETMLSHARYLYVLKLDGIGLKEVPKNLGKLNYLRYLDLSNNPIKYVPESIAHLYLLQTLLLRRCEKLKNTENPPKGITNLTYLSFVEVSPKQFPKKMLPPTVRNMQPPIELDEKGFTKVSEVRDLKDIAGLLRINDLEYVEDKKAAQEAKIGKKHRLSALELHWSKERQGAAGNNWHNHDEDVLDGLQPHPNIQRLKLINYASQQFPMWVMNMKVGENEGLLYKLVKIELVECKRCLQLPTMGQLPCLQELLIAGMDSIEIIGEELYIYGDDSEDKDSLEEFFPALRRLEVRDLSRLTTWKPALSHGKKCQTFMKLETLQVVNCPNLTCIPIDSTSMINLLIQGIQKSDWLDGIIANSCRNQTLTSLVLNRVPDLTALPKEFSQCTSLEGLSLQECKNFNEWPPNPWNLISLKELCIDNCSSLKHFPYRGLTALNTLVIRGCGNLEGVPKRLETFKSLINLAITDCKRVRRIPDLQQLTNLIELDILGEKLESMPAGLHGLPNLRILRVGGGSINFFDKLIQCTSLQTLWVKNTKDLAHLPHQIKSLTQLKVLRVWNFTHLKAVQSWICKLTYLEVLIFEECSTLEHLPPIVMLQLKRLHCLRIEKCAALEERFDDDYWKNVCHVPHIKFKGRWLQGDRRLLLQENPVPNDIDGSATEGKKYIAYYYFIRDKLQDCIRGRSSYCFYFMASCVLHIVIISLQLYWTTSKQH